MARKGILVSSPDVKKMTQTQWMFEYHALKRKEEDQYKNHFETFRRILVSVLGLDLIRPKDQDGITKSYEDMTTVEKDAFIPLVAWCARPDMLKTVAEQVEMDLTMEKAANPDSDYEAMVNAIDAADGDMEPIIGIPVTQTGKVKNPMTELQMKQVQNIIDIDVDGKV